MPTHSETRALPYTAQQMYDLVADVASYPKFLPWCSAARIRSVTPQGASSVMEADLVISFKVFRERFGSRVVLHPDDMKIDTEYLDGPFRYMKSNWAFRDTDQGCEVEFFDFEFKNWCRGSSAFQRIQKYGAAEQFTLGASSEWSIWRN